ncbi:ABC transporter ATP-binding protein [Thermococcus aciditolerans]|uniref:ABC transporter ATP-binding protein n=1 Tax=Thermococcus aciditolerans TaxID=2598455 RepID=A0A5C0SKX9_9EURY|nr:ABC transporter ATP-binding protein [Thermococcus aciditolerans]QEK14930.1 ABC transporter ATP-binding protein [Thermococcus aciditolerans]
MLEVRGLAFSYGDFSIEGVTLEVKEGEVVTLLGPNGSGKTTILKAIYGLLKPKERCVFIDGRDFHELPIRERAKLAGYVPQSHTPPFPYTVLDVVVTGLASQLGPFESPGKEHYEKALEKLGLLGLERFKDKPYTQLSGGQMQLVLIARALVQEPRFLLLDEPTAHLDFKNQVKVLGMVRRLAREGISTIMTLHDPNLTSVYSDRVALVKGGRIAAIGEPKEVIREDVLEEVYGMPVSVLEFNGFRLVIPGGELNGAD